MRGAQASHGVSSTGTHVGLTGCGLDTTPAAGRIPLPTPSMRGPQSQTCIRRLEQLRHACLQALVVRRGVDDWGEGGRWRLYGERGSAHRLPSACAARTPAGPVDAARPERAGVASLPSARWWSAGPPRVDGRLHGRRIGGQAGRGWACRRLGGTPHRVHTTEPEFPPPPTHPPHPPPRWTEAAAARSHAAQAPKGNQVHGMAMNTRQVDIPPPASAVSPAQEHAGAFPAPLPPDARYSSRTGPPKPGPGSAKMATRDIGILISWFQIGLLFL